MPVTSATAQGAHSAQWVQLRALVTQAFVLHAFRVRIRLQSERHHVSTAIPTRSRVVDQVLACAKKAISPPSAMAYLARNALWEHTRTLKVTLKLALHVLTAHILTSLDPLSAKTLHPDSVV